MRNIDPKKTDREPTRPTSQRDQAESTLDVNRLASSLRASALLREYQAVFAGLTGLTLRFRERDSAATRKPKRTSKTGTCSLLESTWQACDDCRQIEKGSEGEGSAGLRTVECLAGVVRTTVSVNLSECWIGLLEIGGVRLQPPPATRQHSFESRASGAPEMERSAYDYSTRLLSLTADHLARHLRDCGPEVDPRESGLVRRAKDHVRTHFGEEIRLASVARLAGYSAAYFSEKFKAETGENFVHYVNRIRVDRTKELLRGRDRSITEIAFEVGFQSLSQFNRAFKQWARTTPREYRCRFAKVRRQ